MVNIIETRGLTKKYKDEMVLNEINMNIEKNKVYGLLGPNGAGKSTLLKILTGIINSSEGEVLMDGEKWSRKNLNKIGSIIEEPVLYDNLTAVENLRVRTMLLGIKEERINEVLRKVNLTDTGKKIVKKFSMGMKQRLGIALALINNPEILILDEPTNGLDPFGIAELREMIRNFANEGITVIISSHILWEIQQIADKIGIINEGELCYEGEIDKEENLEDLFMKITSTKMKGVRKYA